MTEVRRGTSRAPRETKGSQQLPADRPAQKNGAAGLREVDLEEASAFEAAYLDRPAAPVAIVIAAYNEEANVRAVVEAVPNHVCGLGTEVIVVVDGARDATAAGAKEAGALVCDVPVNRGQGAALRLGYHLARERGASFIMTTDADGQYGSDDMERVLSPLVADEADFVSGLAPPGVHCERRRSTEYRRGGLRRADQPSGPPASDRPFVWPPRHEGRGERFSRSRPAPIPGF